jgi:hypothetical protein
MYGTIFEIGPLKNVDRDSFVRIDYDHFKDKNNQWFVNDYEKIRNINNLNGYGVSNQITMYCKETLKSNLPQTPAISFFI